MTMVVASVADMDQATRDVIAALPQSSWIFDPEADELDILLPEESRPGVFELVDEADLSVRVDVETGAPLGIHIYPLIPWLEDFCLPDVAAQVEAVARPAAAAGKLDAPLPAEAKLAIRGVMAGAHLAITRVLTEAAAERSMERRVPA